MAVLAIESSAHTLGVGIVERGRFLANEKSMYPIANKGMVPARVSDFHSDNVAAVIRRALGAAGVGMADLDAVGYTKGPGLGPCLRVAQVAAATISATHGIPLIPVNHSMAHVEVARHASGFADPLALYVSGGNSQILALAGGRRRRYKIYGETFDIGVGNMLDTFAREAGLNPAWGSTVAKLAEKGKYMEMPYTVKGMDFSFTGLLTSAVRLLGKARLEDICFSLQETAFSMLCEATERALLLTGRKELTVSGGVAQSRRLREMLSIMAKEHRARFGFAEDQYNADNGAMVALVAEKMLASGTGFSRSECTVAQRYRADSVEVTWA